MQQGGTYFYPNCSQDPRYQYPNVNSFPLQNNPIPWSNNYTVNVNSATEPNINQYNPMMTPVSTSIYATTPPTFSWAHTVPSFMPWVAKEDPTIPDPVMRFSAPFPPDPCTSQTATSWELLNNLGANKTSSNIHLKRKGDLDVFETVPSKMCITEEKMAARLKQLHISNQYSVPSGHTEFGPYDSADANLEKSASNLQEFEAMLKVCSDSDISSKSIVLAPELKKLVEPDKIFACSLLDKIERPSMAVVLWQPQNKLLPSINPSDSKDEEKRPEKVEMFKENNFDVQINSFCEGTSPFVLGSQISSHPVCNDDDMDT